MKPEDIDIDDSLLPRSALFDTGVFMRFMREKPEEEISPYCIALGRAMIRCGNQIYVAAPSIAEMVRYKGERVPRTRGVEVVAFDVRAAETLGIEMPMETLRTAAAGSGIGLAYFKYDSMIVACALRAKTSTLVALDIDHAKMAKALPSQSQLAVRSPRDYVRQNLFSRSTTPPVSVSESSGASAFSGAMTGSGEGNGKPD